MNITHYLFISFTLINMAIAICGNYSACANEPVTPYPTHEPVTSKTPTDCPNMPIPQIQDEVIKQTNSAHHTITAPRPAGENQQIIPSPAKPSNTTFNVQCQYSLPSCCNGGGLNCTSNSVLIPTCSGPSLIVTCCGTQFCNQIGTDFTTTPAPLTPEPIPAPEPLIICPPGTQLVGKRCHVLYCASGSKMIDDRCIVIQCPQGSVWSGNRCSVPQPIIQNVSFNNTIVTHFNQTNPDIILNNVNNIYVNATVLVSPDDVKTNSECNYDCVEAASSSETAPNQSLRCCEVMTPRMCEQRNNRWRCYSRRSYRCGEFCVAPIIYLQPSRIHATSKYLVMPPIKNNSKPYEKCDAFVGGYDCSGCAFSNMEHCSYYCHRYICSYSKCRFYDQEKYCDHRVGEFGCKEEDGCLDDWCL